MSRGKRAAVVVMAVAGAFAAAGPAAAAPTLGAGRDRPHPSRRADEHRRRAVHGELRLLRRRQRVHRAGGALLGHRREHRDQRVRRRLAAARHGGRGRRRATGTLVYNSWLTMQAQGRRTPTPARTTTRARPARRGRPRSVNPSIPFWGGPTGLTDTAAAAARRCSPTATRRCAAGSRAEPEGGRLARPRRRWLDHAVFTVTPGIRVTRAARSSTPGPALGVVHARSSPRWPAQRRRRPVARAGLHALARRSTRRWPPAPSRSGPLLPTP